jgi:hypothetical protein
MKGDRSGLEITRPGLFTRPIWRWVAGVSVNARLGINDLRSYLPERSGGRRNDGYQAGRALPGLG